MNNFIINNLKTGDVIYHRKTEYTCSICKSDNLPEYIFQKKEVKMLLKKFKMKEMDFSTLINKCNCKNTSSKAHKLCLILNILYNYQFNCQECNAEYNISVKMQPVKSKKISNIIIICFILFINIILYGASAFLILYPLLIQKDYKDNFEQKKFLHNFYAFGGIIFLLNTYFIYITISSLLLQNTFDSNNYTIDIKDINEQNKGKNNDKHYKLIHKFYRYFYQTQIRFLVPKKHKTIFTSKGYGYYNKELKDMIINNNLECEKELEEDNNVGSDVLNLRTNRKKKIIAEKDENNESEMSNSNNIQNKKDINDENINYIFKVKSLNNEENKSLDKKKEDVISKKSNSKKSDKSGSSQKKKNKIIIIENINTDIPNNENEKSIKNEESKNPEKQSKNSKKSENKKKESLSSKDKNDNNNKNDNDNNNNNTKGFFDIVNKKENNQIEKDSMNNKLNEDNNIFNDNFDLLVSTPIHNNGK